MVVAIPDKLDLKSLEIALVVADLGSFRQAAETLGMQTSVVSRRVRALEDSIGVGLFQRSAQGARPTQAGRALLKRARHLLEEVEYIVRAGRSFGEGRGGVLCIGTTASIAGGGARDLLERFLLAHPDVDLSLDEGSSRDHVRDVTALRMDACIVAGRPSPSGCVVESFWSEPIVIGLPESHALVAKPSIAWPELNSERFIVSRSDPGPEIQDYVVQQLAALGRHPQIEVRSVERNSLMALVGLNQGVTVTCGAEASVVYPGVVFRPVQDQPLPFSVVWSERNDNPMLRRFMSLARRWSSEVAATNAVEKTLDPSP